jgi:hypothetical protein
VTAVEEAEAAEAAVEEAGAVEAAALAAADAATNTPTIKGGKYATSQNRGYGKSPLYRKIN